jgi:hypothetical protein
MQKRRFAFDIVPRWGAAVLRPYETDLYAQAGRLWAQVCAAMRLGGAAGLKLAGDEVEI